MSVDPETSHRANEAVRIALGILAGENTVTIALLGAGAKVLDADVEDYVDGEDLSGTWPRSRSSARRSTSSGAPCGLTRGWNPLGLELVPIDRAELAGLLAGSRRALVF